jgi:hypothetical protein
MPQLGSVADQRERGPGGWRLQPGRLRPPWSGAARPPRRSHRSGWGAVVLALLPRRVGRGRRCRRRSDHVGMAAVPAFLERVDREPPRDSARLTVAMPAMPARMSSYGLGSAAAESSSACFAEMPARSSASRIAASFTSFRLRTCRYPKQFLGHSVCGFLQTLAGFSLHLRRFRPVNVACVRAPAGGVLTLVAVLAVCGTAPFRLRAPRPPVDRAEG